MFFQLLYKSNKYFNTENQITCTTETSEMADPVSKGGLDNLELGLAEYADGVAERTFNAYGL